MMVPKVNALPDNIIMDYEQNINMEYKLVQYFESHENPGVILQATTIIDYSLFFDSTQNIRTIMNYDIKMREGTCEDLISYEAEFDYYFSNLTRTITLVISSYNNWDIDNNHVNFYSGKNPDSTESFLVDEVMVIRGKSAFTEPGIDIDPVFNYVKDEQITLGNDVYNSRLFKSNKTNSYNVYD